MKDMASIKKMGPLPSAGADTGFSGARDATLSAGTAADFFAEGNKLV
jgi:hypothetical protein